MQPGQIDKIKKLIQTSPILIDVVEREEWLALLGLMNDKQLLELENILSTDIYEKKVKQEAEPANASKSQAVSVDKNQQPIAGKSPLQSKEGVKPSAVIAELTDKKPLGFTQLPKEKPAASQPSPPAGKGGQSFRHILNFPLRGSDQKKSESGPKVPPEPGKKPAKAEQKPLDEKTAKFRSKLKAILGEKELPTSKQEYPLELPPPAPVKKVVYVPKPVAKIPTVPSKPLPSVPLPPKPKAAAKPATVLPVTGFGKPKAPEAPQSYNSLSGKFAPGVSLPKIPANIKVGSVSSKPIIPKVSESAKGASQQAKLENPTDLAKLDVGALRSMLKNQDASDFVAQLKLAVQKFGYHELAFNMEQSPLYKSYVNTGVKVLSGQGEFGALAPTRPGEEFLTKEEFEEFADLLRLMQAG